LSGKRQGCRQERRHGQQHNYKDSDATTVVFPLLLVLLQQAALALVCLESKVEDASQNGYPSQHSIFDGIALEPIVEVLKEVDWTLERIWSDGEVN